MAGEKLPFDILWDVNKNRRPTDMVTYRRPTMSGQFIPASASPPGSPFRVRIVTPHSGSIFGTVCNPVGLS